jgi:hypothetical protein
MNRLAAAVLLVTILCAGATKQIATPVRSRCPFACKTGVFYFPFGTDTYSAITESGILECEDITSLEKCMRCDFAG